MVRDELYAYDDAHMAAERLINLALRRQTGVNVSTSHRQLRTVQELLYHVLRRPGTPCFLATCAAAPLHPRSQVTAVVVRLFPLESNPREGRGLPIACAFVNVPTAQNFVRVGGGF